MVCAVDGHRRGVLVLDAGNIAVDTCRRILQPFLEGCQLVLFQAGCPGANGFCHPRPGIHLAVRVLLSRILLHVHQRGQRLVHVHGLLGNLQGIGGQRIPLHPLDKAVHPVRNAQDQRDSDNADGAGKSGQQRPAFLGHQVGQAQVQRGHETHGALLFPCFLSRFRFGFRFLTGALVADHLSVQQADNPVRIGICQLRIVGDHNHQPFPGDLPQDFHHLDAGFTVQRAGRFVCQQDLRIVHQRPGNRDTLHLSAAELVGFFAELIRQTDLLQRFLGPAAAFFLPDPGQRQRQLDIGQHSLVGNQVIALEHESDRMVAVGIPVAFLKILCALSADDQVSVRVLVQPSDNIQQRRFPAAGRPQNRRKFAFPKLQVNSPESMHLHFPAGIIFRNLFQCQHLFSTLHKDIGVLFYHI